MELIIAGCSSAFAAIVLGIYACFTAMKKGPILCNAYIGLSPSEIAKLDKEAAYKRLTQQNGCLSVIFTLSTINIFNCWKWMEILMCLIVLFLTSYCIVKAIKTVKKKSK